MAGRPKKVGNTSYEPTTIEEAKKIAETSPHKKKYDRYELKCNAEFAKSRGGGQYLKHWEMKVQLISQDKGIPATGIMLESYRADWANERAHNSKIWLHEAGTLVPTTIIRTWNDDGQIVDKFTYNN